MTEEIIATRAFNALRIIYSKDKKKSNAGKCLFLFAIADLDDQLFINEFVKFADECFFRETSLVVFDYLNGDIQDVRQIERLF